MSINPASIPNIFPIPTSTVYPQSSRSRDKFDIVSFGESQEDFTKMKLQLLELKERKERSYGNVVGDVIQNNLLYKQGACIEDPFLFGKKNYLEIDQLETMRERLKANGFFLDFTSNNEPKPMTINKVKAATDKPRPSSYSINSGGHNASYQELWLHLDADKIPDAAFMLLSAYDESHFRDIQVFYTGDRGIGNKLKLAVEDLLLKRQFLPTIKSARNVVDYGDGPIATFREEILSDEAEECKDSFYPWLTNGPTNFFDAYINSTAPILLLYGPTGTGKTTFVRTMAKHLKACVITTSDTSIATNSALIETYKDIIDRAINAEDPRPHILVIEDVDVLLFSRLQNNREMSKLLNETKGLSSNRNIHIVFSTNLTDIAKVDTALLRPGRCHAALNFRKLTLDEGLKVRKDLGLPETDLTPFVVDGSISLAEAIEEREVKNEVPKSAVAPQFFPKSYDAGDEF